jgi:homocitrate synthase NifV
MIVSKDQPFWIVDTTLRDGEQAPGVVFSKAEKLTIARMLVEAGVAEIEIGTPAMGEDEIQTIRSVVQLRLPSRLTAWCRAKSSDIEAAALGGVDSVHISLPSSAIHLGSLHKTKTWVLDQMTSVVERARREFSFVSIGMQDASRADRDFLLHCARTARDIVVDRFRIADTVGVWNPFQVHEIIDGLRCETPELPLGFHGHNDLGMATANTIAAIMAGVNSVDVTVNGLGERAGNAALEEVVVAMKISLDRPCGVDPRRLNELCSVVEQASGRMVSESKPITGSAVFQHESGIHVNALLTDRRTYEPFAPESVGRRDRKFVLGKHSGHAAVMHVMHTEGVDLDNSQAATLLPLLRAESQRCKKSISPRQILNIHATCGK